MVTAFLFFGTAEISHEDHGGDADACPICLIAQHAENIFRQLRNAGPCFVFFMLFFLASTLAAKIFFGYIPASQVKQKIKMNT
jgi:hypothetical protein